MTGDENQLPVSLGRSGERPILISASILAADPSNLAQAVRDAELAGAASIHIDIMDGHYVHNFTFGLELIPALRRHTSLPMDVHLEIANPDKFIGNFAEASADAIVVCEDTCPDLGATISAIREVGVQVGVSLNPDRPLSIVAPYLAQIDQLVMMAVQPGFGGQVFDRGVLSKIAAARALIDEMPDVATHPVLSVDGGINRETIAEIVAARAERLIMGSAFYEGDPVQNVRSLLGMCEGCVSYRRIC